MPSGGVGSGFGPAAGAAAARRQATAMALRLDRRSEALLERTEARPPTGPSLLSSRSASTATSSASATDLGFAAAGLRT